MVRPKGKRVAPAARPLRAVKERPAEAPVLALGDGVRLYLDLLDQQRALDATLGELRGRILRAMERAGIDAITADGIEAIRQVRHFPPPIEPDRASAILERAGRLSEAQRLTLDLEQARRILDQLYVQGTIDRTDLPYGEPREVDALIVRRLAAGPSEAPAE